ncbi:hypothetical protein Tco_0211483 [Tanacetum coccineum]
MAEDDALGAVRLSLAKNVAYNVVNEKTTYGLFKALKTEHPSRREVSILNKNGEPESYSEALSSKEFVQWKKAINEEMVSLEKNQTLSLVRLPA